MSVAGPVMASSVSNVLRHLLRHAAIAQGSLDEVLSIGLEMLCTMEWPHEHPIAGAIFRADAADGLRLAACHGLDRDQINRLNSLESPPRLARAGENSGHRSDGHDSPHGHSSHLHDRYTFPLKIGEESLGVLHILDVFDKVCGPGELEALESAADIYALIIQRMRQASVQPADETRVATHDPSRAFQLLARAARHGVAADSERGLVKEMVQALVETGGYQAAWVDYVSDISVFHRTSDATGNRAETRERRLYTVAHYGFADARALEEILDAVPVSILIPRQGTVARQRSWVVQNVGNDPGCTRWRSRLRMLETRALCALPLRGDGQGLGVLVVHSAFADVFDGRELDLLSQVTDLASAAIDRLRTMGERDLLSMAIDRTPDSVFVTNRKGRILYVNPAFVKQTDYSGGEAIGHKADILKSGLMSHAFYDRLWNTIMAGESFHGVFANRHKDGSIIHEEKFITPLRDSAGEITYFISTGRDITERKRLEEKLKQLAYHDPFTRLPNRRLLHERAEQVLKHSQWRARQAALLLVDLNDFKKVNDSLGHLVGDKLLVEVVGRFSAVLRDEDTLARLGGEEFAILLSEYEGEAPARVAQRLLESLEAPVKLGESEVVVGAAVGIASFPADGQDTDTLLRNADVAMYRAKAKEESAYVQNDLTSDRYSHSRLKNETDLRDALNDGALQLYYQPVLELHNGRIVGAEALLRWLDWTREKGKSCQTGSSRWPRSPA